MKYKQINCLISFFEKMSHLVVFNICKLQLKNALCINF